MDTQYLADEIARLEAEVNYIRKRYEYFVGLTSELKKENRALRKVLEQYQDMPVPGIGLLAQAALERLEKVEGNGKKRGD